MDLITCSGLTFTYPCCTAPALQEVCFTIPRSSFVLLCGKSGCGKSTLLRQLKKSLTPYGKTEGVVQYCGQDIPALDDRVCASEIGFVQQSPDAQIVTDKVWHELAFGLESLGLDNRTMKQRVAEMASFFGIQTWFRKNVCELSGGQKQLLNLASVMVMKPKLLILDEPTSQLDPIAASDFIAALKKINTELGTTILISEHRLEELFPLADQVLVMDAGRLLIQDSPRKAAAKIAGGVCGDLFCGLPAAVKIACTAGCRKDCPLTVREGRLWMESQLGAPPERPAPPAPEPAPKPQEAPEPPALFMKDVWFHYGRTDPDTLRGVELCVRRGELYALLGGNGVGKTTLLKALTRQIRPRRGLIEINGVSLEKLSDGQLFTHCLAMLPQDPQALFTEITVREELLEALCGSRAAESEKAQHVQQMQQLLGLSSLAQAHPYDLSGGEQQRLALGKILLLEPSVLLLDEPTKGLDPFFKRTLADIFLKLRRNGTTILMVTHDIEFCAEYADRCALLFDGEIVSCGTPRAFFSGNSFYTTTTNRLCSQWFPDAITWEEVAARCAEAITSRR